MIRVNNMNDWHKELCVVDDTSNFHQDRIIIKERDRKKKQKQEILSANLEETSPILSPPDNPLAYRQ